MQIIESGARILGLLLVALILWDVVRTLVVTHGSSGPFRLSRHLMWFAWNLWGAPVGLQIWQTGQMKNLARLRPRPYRENWLSAFAPLFLPFLLVTWLICLLLAWSLVEWTMAGQFVFSSPSARQPVEYTDLVYYSGTSLLTIGYGDIVATGLAARVVGLAEGFTGLATIALLISYLPTLYSSYATRESAVRRLDRGQLGSKTVTATDLIKGFATRTEMNQFLATWEVWFADLAETHYSHPILAYFRSTSADRSWLAAVALVLHTAELLMATDESSEARESTWCYRRGLDAIMVIAEQLHIGRSTQATRRAFISIEVAEARKGDDAAAFETARAVVASSACMSGATARQPEAALERSRELRKEYLVRLEQLRSHLRFGPSIYATQPQP